MTVESIGRCERCEGAATVPAQNALRQFILSLWKRAIEVTRRPRRRLRLCENLPLGERRFVAVIEYEDARFLLGGTSSSLVLLARLTSPSPTGGPDPYSAQPAIEERHP